MQPFVEDRDFLLLNCDVLDGLRSLADESVHCVVTSPPYWGLRDYGTGLWDGGNPDCDHLAPPGGGTGATGLMQDGRSDAARQGNAERIVADRQQQQRRVCGKCGAHRIDQQLGLEESPELYVARMVEVFQEVRRVLRKDGTCWLNIGDSYASSPPGNVEGVGKTSGLHGANDPSGVYRETLKAGHATKRNTIVGGLKPKDLVGIPWKLAFALQADGWYLRSAITWCKPNAMPESVTDRPTKATEMVFLLTRSPRYYYDAEAIRTEHQRDGRAITAVLGRDGSLQHRDGERWPGTGANARDWWLIATEAYPESHFATFPQELVARCVKAGTSERGCCPVCGTPWQREVERAERPRFDRETDGAGVPNALSRATPGGGNGAWKKWREANPDTTLGWRPGCTHEGDPVPATVLDPFAGSGTTNYVARRLGRRSIGIELNPAYCALAARRMQQQSLFAETT